MSRYYRLKKPGPPENLKAGLVAGGIAATAAALSFYLVRVFLAREPLEPLKPREPLDFSEAEAQAEEKTQGGGH
jgi:hypothetical protein